MVMFNHSDEETCSSIAPWLDDIGKAVKCQVPKHELHEVHAGNGWTWTYIVEHQHNFEFVELDINVYAWVCSCGEVQLLD